MMLALLGSGREEVIVTAVPVMSVLAAGLTEKLVISI